MKAVVLKSKNTLVVEDIPRFRPDANQVVIRVKACGICGSDLRYFNGENPWALHTLGVNAVNEPNMILGHEFSGEVVEAGSKKSENLIGKRVVAIPYNTCGNCELCLSGRYNLCRSTIHIGHGAGWGQMEYYPGGMAEYCPVWSTHVCEIPDTISYEDAVIIDPLSVAIHAVNLSEMKPMDDILVLGTGPVGLCIIQTARAYGANNVYCTDIVEASLKIAGSVGVNTALNAKTADVFGEIMTLTKGKGVNVIFDTIGSVETQNQALKMLAVSGKLINLVANETRVNYRLLDLSGERRIICSANSKYDDYLLGIKLLDKGIFKAGPLITHKFPIDDVFKAFDMLFDREKSGAIKVIIEP